MARFSFRRRTDSELHSEAVKLGQILDAEFTADPGKFMRRSRQPRKSDLAFIGRFIQVYCSAENASREIIDRIDEAVTGQPSNAGSKLGSGDVFQHLKNSADRLKDSSLKDALLGAAAIMPMHREHRHTLAHWVVRRVANGRAYFVLSKDNQGGKKRHGNAAAPGHLNYGFMALASLKRETAKLEAHTKTLAHAAMLMGVDQSALKTMLK